MSNPRTQTAERDAYSIQELADRYGVHRTTIYREIWDGRLTRIQVARTHPVSRNVVEAWRNGMRTSERG